MSSSDVEVYAGLSLAFAELGVRWYVFGAQAAILHGAVRFTEDIDVTVEPKSVPTRRLIEALTRQSFESRITDETFIDRTRVVPIVHIPTQIPVDVVLAGPGIEELFFEGSVDIDIEGVHVPVARAEDLVVMKILAGRPKDLEDVAAILAAQADKFDPERTRNLLGLLEQALDQSDLMPLFDELRARAARART